MSLIDWIIESVEEKGRKIARRGDALLGVEEYENTSITDRMSGLLGRHDNGTFKKQVEKRSEGIKSGDVVCVSRGAYDHYGVYISRSQVISYTSDDSDIGDNTIQSTTFARFLRGASEYSVLVFPDKHALPSKVDFSQNVSATAAFIRFFESFPENDYCLYSPKDTVKRAKTRLGEAEYNLMFNNCEHFAIWCKTGVSESHQVNRILKALKSGSLYINHNRILT